VRLLLPGSQSLTERVGREVKPLEVGREPTSAGMVLLSSLPFEVFILQVGELHE